MNAAYKYTRPIVILAVMATMLLSLPGCSSKRQSPASQELDKIATSVCEHPDSALASLEAIDYKSISESDRHYHDFLTIKARDKGYVEHTSDSLILDVIDYYSSNDDRNLYPEVLYYGGRVYSDLGDYPTSLSYFQKALDNLPENYPDRSLESRLSSQTGRLLIGMRLYGEAIPYMERAIKANHATRDTVNLIYNYGLISSAYIYLKDYDKAELNLKNAAYWAQFSDNRLLENIRIDMAAVKLHKNRLDSALAIIRGLPDRVEPEFRNLALANACDIPDSNNRNNGYRIMLSPELRGRIPIDSLTDLILQYNDILQKNYTGHGEQQALMQQSMYNYRLQERKRADAERTNMNLLIALLAASVIALGFLAALLYMKYRNLQLEANLRDALNTAESIRKKNDPAPPVPESTRALREKLTKKLLSLSQENIRDRSVPEAISSSKAYEELEKLVKSEAPLPEDSPLWDSLEKVVLSVSPEFRQRLESLCWGCKLSKNDYHTAILIKCGVSPSELVKLICRSKGAISSRRERLGEKMFGTKKTVADVDAIIRLL